MAQILEREAELSEDKSLLFEAQVHLRTVANRAPPSAEWLSRYIEFLLRHGGVRSVDSNEDSASRRSNSDIAEQKEVFLAEAEAKISDLRKMISAGDRELAALTVAFQASLVKARGRESEAKAIVSEYVAHEVEANQDQDSQARRYLTAGKLYTSIGLHAEAEVWYRRLMDLSPSSYVPVVQSLLAQDKQQEAIELCLKISKDKLTPEIATLLARVTTIAEEPAAEISEVQTAIETAMEDHGGDVELLQAEAVRKASSGRYADAVAIFRRVLEIDPDNALTLNNLATILAEAPASREEALELIQQAIEIAGRQSALLDTQGTIFLDAGNVEQAILCLEEATAGGAPDARFYLHLAAAYHRAQRDDDALRMLTESHEFGLKNTILTESDRKLLALLNEQLQPLATTAGTTL
jgi:Flp pilus assembly protein TadD